MYNIIAVKTNKPQKMERTARGQKGKRIMISYKINVLEELKNVGLNQTELRKTGFFSQSVISKFRAGDTNISVKTLDDLCEVLGKEPKEIIEFHMENGNEYELTRKEKKWYLNDAEKIHFPCIKKDFDVIKSNNEFEIRNTSNEWEMTKIILGNNLDITPCVEDCILKEIHFFVKYHTKEIVAKHPELGESDQSMYNIFSSLIKYAKRKTNLIYGCSKIDSREVINAAKACIAISILLNELIENNLFPQFRLELMETLSEIGSENLAVCTKKNALLQGLE